MKFKITLFAISTLLITGANRDQLKSHIDFNRGPASEEVKDQKVEEKKEDKKDEKSEIANLLCLAKNEAAKLSEDIKKLLKDKEEVVTEVNKLKKENEDLKNKPSEDKVKKPATNEDIVSMLGQMTNMMLSQQQLQMQMQNQMFSMMNPMNDYSSMNMFNQFNPYAYNPYNLNFNYGFNTGIYSSPYPSMNSMNSMMGIYGNSIGLGANINGIGNYYGYQASNTPTQSTQVFQQAEQNRAPAAQYSMLPQQNLEQPQVRSYDFTNGQNTMKQPEVVQMQRQAI